MKSSSLNLREDIAESVVEGYISADQQYPERNVAHLRSVCRNFHLESRGRKCIPLGLDLEGPPQLLGKFYLFRLECPGWEIHAAREVLEARVKYAGGGFADLQQTSHSRSSKPSICR
jgi:hypothetical protein